MFKACILAHYTFALLPSNNVSLFVSLNSFDKVRYNSQTILSLPLQVLYNLQQSSNYCRTKGPQQNGRNPSRLTRTLQNRASCSLLEGHSNYFKTKKSYYITKVYATIRWPLEEFKQSFYILQKTSNRALMALMS